MSVWPVHLNPADPGVQDAAGTPQYVPAVERLGQTVQVWRLARTVLGERRSKKRTPQRKRTL